MNGFKDITEGDPAVSPETEILTADPVKDSPDGGVLSWLVPAENQSRARLFSKLAGVMAQMSRVRKNGFNDHFRYNFVRAEDVAEKVREALATAGVAFFAEIEGFEILPIESVNNRGERKIANKTFVRFLFTFADGETGATFSCKWTGEAIDDQDKDISKAATSALKYFLLKTFIIPTGEDDPDADGDKTKKVKSPASAPHPQASTPVGAPADSKRAPADAKDFTTFWTICVPALGVDKKAAEAAVKAANNDALAAYQILVNSVP